MLCQTYKNIIWNVIYVSVGFFSDCYSCYASLCLLSSLLINLLDPARVVWMPRETYLPAGMGGTIVCPVQAEPPMLFINWTKDGTLLDVRQVATRITIVIKNTWIEYFWTKQCFYVG